MSVAEGVAVDKSGRRVRAMFASIARRYLVELLRFRVTDRVREGVERFAREASEAGLIPGARVPWREGRHAPAWS